MDRKVLSSVSQVVELIMRLKIALVSMSARVFDSIRVGEASTANVSNAEEKWTPDG